MTLGRHHAVARCISTPAAGDAQVILHPPPRPPRAQPDASLTGEACFTKLEEIAIALGASDLAEAVRPTSLCARLMDFLLYPVRPTPLSNPRLEALRHYAWVLASGRSGMSGKARTRAIETGFNPRQLDDLVDRLDPGKRVRKTNSRVGQASS